MSGLAKHNPQAPTRKQPVTSAVLNAVTACGDLDNPHHLQLSTIGAVAHDGLLRGRELMLLTKGDVTWDPSGQSCVLKIKGSKCNKDGKRGGPIEHVYLHDYGPTSAVALLKRYGAILHLGEMRDSAPLWPEITDDFTVRWDRPISKGAFVKEFQALLTQAGMNASQFSGHSFRAGGATDLWLGNCPPELIKRHGRWKSDCFYIYIRYNPHVQAAQVASCFYAASA